MGKDGFFKTIGGMVQGVVHPHSYIETGKKATWISVHVLVILVSALLPLILFFIPINNKIGNNRLADEVDDRIAYFCLNEDGFECKKQYEWQQEGEAYIKIDTADNGTESDEVEDLLETGHYSTMVIVTSQEIFLYSDDTPTRILWSSVYEHLQSIEKRAAYDKDVLIQLTKMYDTPVLLGVTALLALLLLIESYLAGVLWGCIGGITKRVLGLTDEIEFSDMVKSVLLIRTPWLILTTVIAWGFLRDHLILMHEICAAITLVYLISSVRAYARQVRRIPEPGSVADALTNDYDGD